MPCTLAARRASSVALASAVVALAVGLTCLAPAVRGADTVSKATPDTSVRITTSPPAIQIDTTTQAKKDETTDDTNTTSGPLTDCDPNDTATVTGIDRAIAYARSRGVTPVAALNRRWK